MCSTYTRRDIFTLPNGGTYSPNIRLQNVLGFRILKVLTHNAFYNIIENVHENLFWVDSASTNHNVAIPYGQYEPFSLAQAIEDAMNGVGSPDTHTVTYDTTTKLFTIAADNAIELLFTNSPNLAAVLGYVVFDYPAATSHLAPFIGSLVPSHYLLKSNELGAGRASFGGGGGTQISNDNITGSPQDYLIALPNQVDGSYMTYAYMSRDEDYDQFRYSEGRVISDIDLTVVHPEHPTASATDFLPNSVQITYEIEFVCASRFK